MDFRWTWLPVAYFILDLAVLALALRARRPRPTHEILDAFANLATLSGFLAWIRWGGGVERPGWALVWLCFFYAWSLAMVWVADYLYRRPVGRLRFFCAVADAVCLAAVAGYLYFELPWFLAGVWVVMAAGYAVTAAVFRAHVPEDVRGAGMYMALAAVLCALAPASVFRTDALAGPPHPATAACWVLLGPTLAALGFRWRCPMLRYVGLGMIGLLTVRALYDCRPPEKPRPPHRPVPAAMEAVHAVHPPPAPFPPPPGEDGDDDHDGPSHPVGEVVVPMERIIARVRPRWLMAMAPLSMLLAAGVWRLGLRRRADALAVWTPEPSRSIFDPPPPATPAASPPVEGGAEKIASDPADPGEESPIARQARADAWLSVATLCAFGVMAVFFVHLEWSAWLSRWGLRAGDIYYMNGAGTAALWSLASIPFFLARGPGARWTGLALLAVAWITLAALLARAWGLAEVIPAWRNVRPMAYACVVAATAVWARTFDKDSSRRRARGVAVLTGIFCLVVESLVFLAF